MRDPHHPAREEFELSDVLHALSDPARLAIVRELQSCGECTCGKFEMAISKATLSHHFRVLREAGVIHQRPDGRKRILSLRRPDLDARFPGLIDAVLAVDGGPRRAPAQRNGHNGAQPALAPVPPTA